MSGDDTTFLDQFSLAAQVRLVLLRNLWAARDRSALALAALGAASEGDQSGELRKNAN